MRLVLAVTVLCGLLPAAAAAARCAPELAVAFNRSTALADGTVWDEDSRVAYPPGYAWREAGGEWRGCLCLLRPCLRKCCPAGQAFNATARRCGREPAEAAAAWRRLAVADALQPHLPFAAAAGPPHFVTLEGEPCRHGRFRLAPHRYPEDAFSLLSSGELLLNATAERLDASRYCLEFFDDAGDVGAIGCFPPEPVPVVEVADVVRGGLLLASVPFLLATFVLHALVPRRRKLHGWNVMSYVASTTVSYLALAAVQFFTNRVSGSFCTAAGGAPCVCDGGSGGESATIKRRLPGDHTTPREVARLEVGAVGTGPRPPPPPACQCVSTGAAGMTLLVTLVLLLAIVLAAAAADQPCPVELSAPVSRRSRTLTTAGGLSFEAQLWSDGSRACPCLQRGCMRKCCPAGYVSNQLGDCVPVSTDTVPTVRPLPPVQDHQPPSRHLEALIPKVVAIVEQLGNKSGGNLSSPVDSSEGAQPDEVIKNLSRTLLGSLTEVHPGTGRQSNDDNLLLYTKSDMHLPTVRQRESLSTGAVHQPSAKHLATLEALIPKVVAIVEQLNSSGGNLTAPLNSSGDAQPKKLSSVSFESLLATTNIGPGTSRHFRDDSALLYTTSDRQLPTVRLREAVKVLSTQLDKVYPAASTAGVSELVDELKESLANISNELSESNSGAVDVGSGSDRTPGTIETLLFLLADRTEAPLHNMFVLYGSPCPCSRYETDEPFEMLDNGTLAFESYTVPVSEYCFGETLHGNLTLYLCFPASECPEEEKDAILFYPAGTVLSLPFLAATFAVYALFEELRNRVGAALMCYVAALFVGYALLAAVQLSMGYVSMAFCLTAAFIIYFSFLASFFWLNVMCFDIFWTFSGFRSLRGTAREREHKKFIIYSIYSWGCPLILLCVTLVMQFHENIPDGLLRPQFGEKKCWFPDDITILAYFYGPVGILVLCNIILFILTAIRIAQLKRETAMLKGADSRRHDDDNRQRFNLYLKLFLVMGVNWSMEVISGLVGGPEYVWYVTDICNTLQGVLIFVIFVWKDRIRRMLMEKFCPKRASTKLSKSTLVTYSTRTSPSRLSHGVLNNKVTDNSNGDVKITAITHISDDSDVP